MHPLHFDPVGFWLPLLLALFCSIGACEKIRCRDGLLWLAATFAAFAMTEVVGRQVSVGTAYSLVAVYYLIAARFRPSRPPVPARLVFALMFFSVLVPDVLVARFAPLPAGANQATVGGFGRHDGLLLKPFAVGFLYFLPYLIHSLTVVPDALKRAACAHWWPLSLQPLPPLRAASVAPHRGGYYAFEVSYGLAIFLLFAFSVT